MGDRCESVAGAGCATAACRCRGGSVSGRSWHGISRCGAGSRRCAGDTAPAFEIGRVPTRTLELEAGGAELFAELGRTTGRAIGQGGVGDFLQNILGMSAGLTLVGVNGHEEGSFQVENSKLSIIGGGRLFKSLHTRLRSDSDPIQTRFTRPRPICDAQHAGCGWLGGPKSQSACPPDWPAPRPVGPETPRQQA